MIVRVNRAVYLSDETKTIGIVCTTADKKTCIIDYQQFVNAGWSYLSAFQMIPLPYNTPIEVYLTSEAQLDKFERAKNFKGLY